MEDKNTAVAIMDKEPAISPFTSVRTFETAQRMATMLCNSSLVPTAYQGKENLPNCVIALEMANRIGVSPFLIMQNMHVIQGRPSMSSQYLIGMVNASGKFSPLRWRVEKRGTRKFSQRVDDGWDNATKRKKFHEEVVELEDCTYVAWAREIATGEVLEGPEVTTEMAIREGWYSKSGSKWLTMPDLMFRYRSAAFFSRMYCPEMAMGLRTTDEIEDIPEPEREIKKVEALSRAEALAKRLSGDDSVHVDTVAAETAPVKADARVTAKPAVEADGAAELAGELVEAEVQSEEPRQVSSRLETASLAHGQQAMDFSDAPPDDAFEIPTDPRDGDPF